MMCPQCDQPLGNAIEHVKKCSIDPQRLLAVGLITVEESNIINRYTNDKGDVIASPRLNNN